MSEHTLENIYMKRIFTAIIVLVLAVLSFFLMRPIILSIALGVILAFIFSPIYNWIERKTGSKNLTATLLCIILILIIVLPIWFFTPMLLNQAIKVYSSAQQMDFVTPLKAIFPSLFSSQQFSSDAPCLIVNLWFRKRAYNILMHH